MASHRRFPQPGLAARTTRVTVLSAAGACAALAGGTVQMAAAEPGGGAPDSASRPDRLDQLARLDQLYQQAEQATERYDAAQEHADRLRADLTALQDRAARGRERVNRLRDEVGALAAGQYRSGGIDPALALLLSARPADYLDRAGALDRLTLRQADRLRELQEAERTLRQRSAEAAGKFAELDRTRRVLQERKRSVQRALAEAQALLAAMPAADRARYDATGRYDRASRDSAAAPGLPGVPDLPDAPRPSGAAAASGRAALAVAAARGMLGAPYVWGATGPHAFDCSGLVQYAYGRAGVALPRTSREQMNAGHRVPLAQVRPGDLVVYRADASHIALYVGAGQVIHAPYPGARVRYDPVDMMPITAVTRP